MVNYFIYAKDFSGSTHYMKHFHYNGLKSLEQFKSDVDQMRKKLLESGEPPTESKIIYLHWGDACYEVDEDTTRETYESLLSGHMGTYPETIITWLQQNGEYDICGENNKIRLLYIITDGLIGHDSVGKCFEINEKMHYETVVFHAFNEDVSQIDYSVASSFFKSRCMTYCNYIQHDNTDISAEFDYDKINVDNFRTEIESLKSYIRLKFMKIAKSDARALREINQLKKLRARLFEELSSHEDKVNLETKDKSLFLRDFVRTEWYTNLFGENHNSRVNIEKIITSLINYIVSESKSYSFDALKFNLQFSKSVEEEEEPNIDVNFTSEQEIAFPDIIFDDDKGIPVIILQTFDLLDKLIFHGTNQLVEVKPASFSKFKSTMECPLFLANDQDISESIGYFYTLEVYKEFLASNVRTEPRTRKQFHGGLVLTETDQFDRYNDYIISATYFRSKKVNFNVGLFYYILWKNCENKEWMDRNVVERFKKYAMRRISETVCKIGLSSLPLQPQEITSLPTALWYCVELSSCIFKNDPKHFEHERLRMFSGIAKHMMDILKYFNYDLDTTSIERRVELLNHVTILKRISKHEDRVYYLLEKIFKTDSGFLISEIDKPCNLYKLNYLKLNHKEMLHDTVRDETVHLNDFVHLMYFESNEVEEEPITICEKTFRPFFVIDKSKSFYTGIVNCNRKVVINNDDDKDKVKISYEPIDSLEFDRILSLYNLFIKCVTDLEKYPTLPEYTDYVIKKKRFHGDLVTIFSPNTVPDIKDVYDKYQKIVSNVDVKDFTRVCKMCVGRSERIKTEERIKFEDDDEISKFITTEELKVNLKKKTQ